MSTSIILSLGNLTLFFMIIYSSFFKNKFFQFFQIFIYILVVVLFISLRDIIPNSDTATYIEYFNYYDGFETVYHSYFAWKGDYFFFFLGWIIKLFTNSESLYIFLLDFIAINLLFFAYYRILNTLNINKNTFIVLIFFVFSTSSFIFLYGNVIRQGLSVSLVLLAISYFIDKKVTVGIFYFILAILTHKSSLIFLPIFIIVFYYDIKWLTIFFILGLSFSLSKLELISMIGDFNILFVSDKILVYQGAEQANIDIKLYVLFFNFIYLLFAINKSYVFDKLFKIWILLFAIVLFSSEIEKFASRLILYNDIILPILYYLVLFINKDKKYFKLLFTLNILFVFLYSVYVYNHQSILNTICYTNTLF
jgi:hypothetical protein